MKFDYWKDIVSQRSYFKSQPEMGDIGGSWEGEPKILENAQSGGEPKILENAQSGGMAMKLGGKNKHTSYIRDWHNRNGSALFGGVGGRVNSEKLEKIRYF